MVTGALLYIPLGVLGGAYLLRANLIAPSTLIQVVAIAVAYSLWSRWNHARSAVAGS